jgi:thiamine-monophosphate kinase
MQVQQTSPHGKAGPFLVVTISELGERRLLERITARLKATSLGSRAGVVIGIGDDAAVVATSRNEQQVVTVDAVIEGVHFERDFSTAADVGHRALAVNLSDLAAMGAEPRWALLSLALPGSMPVIDVEELVGGLAVTAAAHRVAVIGGNLTRSPAGIVVDVTAIGAVPPRRVLTRSGARPGDVLYVSGSIGGAAAGLEMLRAARADQGGVTVESLAKVRRGNTCIEKYLRPEPRVRLGLALSRAQAARAAMDLSDGLADAVSQVAEASGCGVELDAGALPIEPAAADWWRARQVDPVNAALIGGDDYELLIASPPRWRGRLAHVARRVAAPSLTRIGVLTKNRDQRVLVRDGTRERLVGGFEHWQAE